MDQGRALAALLSLAVIGAADAPLPPPREALWTVPANRLDALLQDPAECVALPPTLEQRASLLVGRVAFNTPLLLGGQAARAGMSCASCHRNGRGNPHFSFPGLSGAPGTADVTSSLMSRARGDSQFNPRPIPDLAMDAPKVSRDADKPEPMRVFIRGLIVEEFDGAEPSPAILDGLVAYVMAQTPKECADRKPQPRTAARDAGEAVLAVEAARERVKRGDDASAQVMLSAARTALGRISERFPGDATMQRRLARLDQQLQPALRALDEGRDAERLVIRWQVELQHALPTIAASEPSSLYARDRLAAALQNRP